jgi:superfamily II DNA or RNA helicase
MPTRTSVTGSELFIVDNSDADWKVLRYLHDWCQISKAIDVATGYFEIGSLLALKDEWQKVDQIRILMGDECSMRTRSAFERGLAKITAALDASIEQAKEKNDFLTGVPAIVDAIRAGKILCRVYRKEKFHAKAYITHARLDVVGSAALVGSSNFTQPGITENIELNVQITGAPVNVLQEWYEEHWNAAEDVTPEILRVIERHVREYAPFQVYAKALQEFFRGHEMTETEWEKGIGPRRSAIYSVLDQYQRDGYQQLKKIAGTYRGAFLCDGVGLGKTFVGLMLIEWLAEFRNKRVALFVPKASREAVWEAAVNRYLPNIGGVFGTGFVIFNHSDLQRAGKWQRDLNDVAARADAIIIDEAHHFRNPGTLGAAPVDVPDPSKPSPGYIPGRGIVRPSRYRRLYELAEGKELYLLTATPVNNRLIDFQHMIELFSRKQADYFKSAPLNIHSLPGHFRRMEKNLEQSLHIKSNGQPLQEGELATDLSEAEKVLSDDALFRALVVQRSRAYVKRSQEQHGGRQAIFPNRQPPKVAEYELKKTYGKLLSMVEKAFEKKKPLFSLAVYDPANYYRGDKNEIPEFDRGRQAQIVGLVRTSFLKRFESSAEAFKQSCESLLLKLLAWVEVHSETDGEKRRFERWKAQHPDLVGQVERQRTLFDDPDADEDEDVNFVPEEMLAEIEKLDRDKYHVDEILAETYLDLDQLAEFLKELARFKPAHDDKLQTLLKLLKSDPVLKAHKVLIFSEFMATARYLKAQLIEASIQGVEEIDSAVKGDRGDMIRRFSPYYNGATSGELANDTQGEIRILISTDVLSEGLNLQDATRLINYDLHWNPVRLMQRIGRVDRRMNPDIEAKLVADHPDQKDLRGVVAYWNFLPPDELNQLLTLYSRVTHKTLRISKTFGIEGKKLLTPEDDYQALKDFTEAYEGRETPIERMHLEYQDLLRQFPDLSQKLDQLPGRVFSGKQHPKPGTRAIFFCYARPGPPALVDGGAPADASAWSEATGDRRWYLYTIANEAIVEDPTQIIDAIRCAPDTPRVVTIPQPTLAEIRAKVEKHMKNTYFKAAQAPIGVKPVLKAWMELS